MLFCSIQAVIGQSDKAKYDKFVNQRKANAGKKYTYSQFAIALRYSDELGLTTAQVDAMYREVKELKTLKNQHYQAEGESLDTRGLESSKMVNLLTASQYEELLRYKNHSKAKRYSEKDWKEMELRNLTEELDEEQTTVLLYEYYIIRQSLYDKYEHDPLLQAEHTRAHYQTRPTALRALKKARWSNENNTLGQDLNGN